MDKLAQKMNELPRLSDTDKESDLGYIFGVSGPGESPRPLLTPATVSCKELMRFFASL